MLKIVQVQYSMESAGGAALKLQNAFLNANFDSSIITLYSGINKNEKIITLGKRNKYISLIDDKIQGFLKRKGIERFGLFSYPVLGTDISKITQIRNADIIYLHWILGGFLNFRSLRQLAKLGKPIIFVMHDMWTITGGCHHSFDCEKYKTGCHNCQIFSEQNRNDLSSKEFTKKLSLFSKFKNFYFVSPSKWLYNCAKKSLLTRDKPVFHIPNVIEKEIFKPFDKRIAKQILNIDPSEKVLVFGAISITSPYKGWEYLKSAFEKLKDTLCPQKITVIIFGKGYSKTIADAIPFKKKFMGYLSDNLTTNIVYNSADVFIVPSVADNLPSTILESLSCGTPVVAFNTGGIPDLIDHTQNGYLAKYKDSEDIANGIIFCLKNNLKGYNLKEFETDETLSKHLDLFDYINSVRN